MNELTENQCVEGSNAVAGRLEQIVMAIQREKAARFIEQQMNWETKVDSDNKKSCVHYGACELRELLDYIYGAEPTSDAEKINIVGKGWH